MSDSSRSGTSRADQLRQKRQQSSQQHSNTVRQQAVRSTTVGHAPSTARRTSPYAVPTTSSVRSTNARKLHYTHSANGVEIRMPALPSVQFNWQTASLFIAFTLLIMVILMATMNTFQVSTVKLAGAQRVTTADVTPVVLTTAKSIFTLDRNDVLNAVKTAFPEFSAIRLSISFPNGVVLTVKERQPILAWSANGSTQWIASDGVVMPTRGDAGSLLTIQSSVAAPAAPAATAADVTTTDATATDAPTATEPAAVTGPSYIDPQILSAAIAMSAQLPSGASLVYDPVSGMGWQDPAGYSVFFGLDLSNIALKQAEYQAIIQRLQAQGITPTLISVANVDSPFYRTE
jgi:hypothetical protein